jgi:hypothetical protein
MGLKDIFITQEANDVRLQFITFLELNVRRHPLQVLGVN